MSSHPGQGGGSSGPPRMDRDTEILVILVAGVLLAVTVLPAMLAKWATGLDAWLLQHHILVPTAQALFTLPGMSSGPDLRRLLVLACALAVIVFLIPSRAKKATK
ncbi:MAG: hypothetical protein L0H96_09430 [Humibacillus sp.]|nr:hypothetical protein [Humibacillus sp.]MDN5777119.1 hypothetical protein [Humibacillus sp.]